MSTKTTDLKIELQRLIHMSKSQSWDNTPPGPRDGLFAEALLQLLTKMENIEREMEQRVINPLTDNFT